jgi:hypothetical protein
MDVIWLFWNFISLPRIRGSSITESILRGISINASILTNPAHNTLRIFEGRWVSHSIAPANFAPASDVTRFSCSSNVVWQDKLHGKSAKLVQAQQCTGEGGLSRDGGNSTIWIWWQTQQRQRQEPACALFQIKRHPSKRCHALLIYFGHGDWPARQGNKD